MRGLQQLGDLATSPGDLDCGRGSGYALGVLEIIGRVCWLTLYCESGWGSSGSKKSIGNVDMGGKGVG